MPTPFSSQEFRLDELIHVRQGRYQNRKRQRRTMKDNYLNQEFSDENRIGYDAIVVGSGYGGSIAACRLAQAGIRVCLLEKGRRWDAQDFPTNSFQGMLATRVETLNLGCYGSKTALFRVIQQGDSLAMVCSGLGGGSLINAGVLVPTPMRARRDWRFPQEWENDWSSCQAMASWMLRPEAVPHQFPNARVMRDIAGEIEESSLDPIRLSITFKAGKNSAGLHQNACKACGNCLAGCPYNAKNSTDKNYLTLAIQAGCEVKTECQVQFVVPTTENNVQSCCTNSNTYPKPGRRWRVHLDEVEYLSSDFVVLSAGVLGTAEILFQSQRRGLGLSEKLGYGFSCNGNNVAYLGGSSAPLKAYGLKEGEFARTAKADRPGPTISTSYTSSLGFTIQCGVLPTAYPYMLFKGIGSYGWPPGYWFLHGVIDKFKHLLSASDCQAMILNMIGFDNGDGRIALNNSRDRIKISPPKDPLLPRKIRAFQKLAKRLGGILFMSRFRSTSVHLLGGCNAAQNCSLGVANPSGQVFNPYNNSSDEAGNSSESESAVHSGLYVCDASLIPCAIGINPCLTIATVAEHVAIRLVDDALKYKRSIQLAASEFQSVEEINQIQMPKPIPVSCTSELDHTAEHDVDFIDRTIDHGKRKYESNTLFNTNYTRQLPGENNIGMEIHNRSGVIVKETMHGRLGGMPCRLYVVMQMNPRISSDSGDSRNRSFGDDHPLLRGRVGGHLQMKALEKEIIHIVDGSVNMCCLDPRTPYTQYMHYYLLLTSASGARYILEGKKRMHPFLFGSTAWTESTTLHVNLRQITWNYKKCRVPDQSLEFVELEGDLHLSAVGLLRSLITLRGREKGKFVLLLAQSIFRTYILQKPRGVLSHVSITIEKYAYPCNIFHKITAKDGVSISCRQWKCTANSSKGFDRTRDHYPVLLLNGHSTENYYLPTEPTDLIRTLLKQGYEAWLLQPRLHPMHSSNKFTIEDIARYDIPAAFGSILEAHGPHVKVHVIAHCVGGLAIHMALLGGHISISNIASLACSNSSMFFKVTNSAYIKLLLPLIPISMAILGNKTVLSMFDNPIEGWRHKLLRSITKTIPRTERCTYNECEVFSGIFGNAFWHDNITPTMHHWLNKQAMPHLPMAAFPHLRAICIAGHIVDSKGNNTFLIHPERMALPTTYISGGRSLLVTPQTSLLAHRFMKLHQPSFHHERVVVAGFGHSDLLIGENSRKHVFPHIISHLNRAEECRESCQHVKDPSYARESIAWEKPPSLFGSHGLLFCCFSLIFFFYKPFFSACTSIFASQLS